MNGAEARCMAAGGRETLRATTARLDCSPRNSRADRVPD